MLNDVSKQADFSYDCASNLGSDAAGLPARVAIFGADEHMRAQIAADLGGAGFRTIMVVRWPHCSKGRSRCSAMWWWSIAR